MARKPMVTRTIKTTKCTVMCANIQTAECENKVVVLPRTFSEPKKLDKAVHEAVDTESLKVVSVVASEEIETLYGMDEQDFINNAKVLDKETRKEI